MMILISIRIIDSEDHENVDITANSSPIRLIEGGGARFVRLAGSHQREYSLEALGQNYGSAVDSFVVGVGKVE